ncbi:MULTISPECIES: cellulose binding domain-containing protein [unclassified Microbispora]|uniref:poly(ethylene terephthalate) hydrolase family protein n=1 Tax=unclassified Microbispora TaxID=2614687 RepID=UPI0014733AF8|nr:MULTISPECIES: cellulose binding domain-containing protein [unclassified Microbispora]
MHRMMAATVVVLGLLSVTIATHTASAADNPYQRGPDPTLASVSATRGTFATAQVSVPAGNGFASGVIYYPTDTSQGTFGGVAIVPGYSALFANEEAWMGPWLASFGFVVIGIETNSRTDSADARGTQLLAALDYLTQRSAVRDRVDPNRLSVIGHSAGGAGVLSALLRRPTLKAAVGLAPGSPVGDYSLYNDRVPTMFISGERDTTVTRSYLNGLYTTIPASTPSAWVEITGVDHLFATRANTTEMRVLIPWLKIFLDNDTRYTQFLCPQLADPGNVSMYRNKCPYVPPGGSSPSASPSTSPSASPSTSPSASPSVSPSPSPSPSPSASPSTSRACTASYRTVNSWSGGFQGEVTVTAGTSAINGWTVGWTLSGGQTINQLWNGTLSANGSAVRVTNVSYNGSIPASGSSTFGFLGTGTPSNPTLTCTSP